MDFSEQLIQMNRDHGMLVAFDSDGCVFDSMEVKHKECFCPAFIKHFKLQQVSKYAREAWEFVNLYSRDRGCNRFKAVITALDFLAERPEVHARAVEIPPLPEFRDWVAGESKLGNPALRERIESSPTPEMASIYTWSLEVNARIADLVHGVPPLPGVIDVLTAAGSRADLIVVSQTPLEALSREWVEHDIARYIQVIAGQEHGTKTEHLALAAADHYTPESILMIGDAPGDFEAADANGTCFFPILPGAEEASWTQLRDESLDHFFNGRFAGDYQQSLMVAFDAALPATPPWQ